MNLPIFRWGGFKIDISSNPQKIGMFSCHFHQFSIKNFFNEVFKVDMGVIFLKNYIKMTQNKFADF